MARMTVKTLAAALGVSPQQFRTPTTVQTSCRRSCASGFSPRPKSWATQVPMPPAARSEGVGRMQSAYFSRAAVVRVL